MQDIEREDLIKTTWQLHSQIEKAYLDHPARKGDIEWPEKQRLLLADMAIHLLQTSLGPDDLNLEHLRNNLNAILVITDQYLPQAELKKSANKLFEQG
ncbi:hypothetical protein HR060_04445 [Catenovulum sp. SM1970]|uniref:hypothetical protein n=1 Tax=Marinifaba aquimaris TaxID=2741323 RepID=UPI0015746D25|nr:hypothetical protein [Marinifaba aquimaris]NTS76111.1 hypothetical protein [Marinifaba aquimaris]